MENNSLENVPQNIGNRDLDIVSKIKSGKVATTAIGRDMLPFLQKAGLATGFEVRKIAEQGEEFPIRLRKVEGVSKIRVALKGSIAVSIEKPEGAKDFGLFWDNFRSLEPKKVRPPSKPTTKPTTQHRGKS